MSLGDCSGVHQVETLDAPGKDDLEVHQEEGFAGQRGGEDVLVITLIDFSRDLLFSPFILFSPFAGDSRYFLFLNNFLS